MKTVRDLIRGSLRLIGAIATGEPVTAEEQNDALSLLNDMLESWSLESLMVRRTVREQFSSIPTQQFYTIGPLANFNTQRPADISQAAYVDNDIETPVKILTQEEWAAIPDKSITSEIPIAIYFDANAPIATVYVYPVPASFRDLVLYNDQTVASYASVEDQLNLAPGEKKAIRYNLALELAAEYQIEPNTAVVAGATDGKMNLKRKHGKSPTLRMDVALSGGRTFNIINGD